MNQSLNRIKDSLLAGQPIVQIVSFEEKRVEGFLKKLCQQDLKNQNIYSWDSHNGLSRGEAPLADCIDPARALDMPLAVSEPAFFVFKDLTPLPAQRPGPHPPGPRMLPAVQEQPQVPFSALARRLSAGQPEKRNRHHPVRTPRL